MSSHGVPEYDAPVDTTIEESISITAAPEAVFDLVQDSARRPEWDERVLRAWVERASAPGKGARLFVQARVLGPLTATTELEYVLFERPRRTAVKIVATRGPALMRAGGGTWIFAGVDGGTRFTTRFGYEVHGGALGRVLDRWFFRGSMERLTRSSLSNLKRLLEPERGP